MKTVFQFALALVLILALFTTAALAEKDIPDGVELADQQVLNLVLPANVSGFDIYDTGWVGETWIASHTLEGLLAFQKDDAGNESIGLTGATAYEISDDGLTYTFHLREDAVWNDGVAVTAQQYVDAVSRVLNIDLGLNNAASFVFVKNGQDVYDGKAESSALGITAPDDYTLVVEVDSPSVETLEKLAGLYPIRLDVVEKAKNEYGTQADELVANGPFYIASFVPDSKVVLKKNESYWDADHVYLDTVNFDYVVESGTQATLFDARQLDVVEYNEDYGPAWDAKAEAGQIEKIELPRAYIRWLIYNFHSDSPLVQNQKVRLALSLAINRQEFVDTIFGRYSAAYDFVPPVVTVNGVPFNQFEAGTIKDLQAQYPTDEALQELLKEGLAEAGYEYSTLKDVHIRYTDRTTSTLDQARIEYLGQNWEDVLGITVDVAITNDFTYMSNTDYDLTLATWNGGAYPSGYLVDLYDAKLGRASLAGYYENAEFQAILDSAKGVIDPEKVAEIYEEAETLLLTDAGSSPIYWADYIYYQQNYVAGIQYGIFSTSIGFANAYIVKH